jgi:hypothetical protein
MVHRARGVLRQLRRGVFQAHAKGTAAADAVVTLVRLPMEPGQRDWLFGGAGADTPQAEVEEAMEEAEQETEPVVAPPQ